MNRKIQVRDKVWLCHNDKHYQVEVVEIIEKAAPKGKTRFEYLVQFQNGHTERYSRNWLYRSRTSAIKTQIRQLQKQLDE